MPSVTESVIASPGALYSVVAWLRRPLVVAPGAHGRRVRLLALMLIALVVLMAVALVLIMAVDLGSPQTRADYFRLVLAGGAAFSVAYGLNASGRYTAAAWVTVIAAMLQPWSSLAIDPAVIGGDFMPLIYASISVLLASFLLSWWATVLVAAAECIGLASIPLLNPSAASFNWPSLITFVGITSAIGILGSMIAKYDLDEIDSQRRRLAESESLLRELSMRDYLTGLFNRRYLEETLAREIIRSTRSNSTIGVILLDVDNLKRINDRRGHDAGDEVLRRVGSSAAGLTRGSDVASRYGGDEFVLVLPETSQEVTLRRSEELRTSVKALPLEPDGDHPTISLGVAMFPHDGATSVELLKAADEALYTAKRAGRDQTAVAE